MPLRWPDRVTLEVFLLNLGGRNYVTGLINVGIRKKGLGSQIDSIKMFTRYSYSPLFDSIFYGFSINIINNIFYPECTNTTYPRNVGS